MHYGIHLCAVDWRANVVLLRKPNRWTALTNGMAVIIVDRVVVNCYVMWSA